MDTYSMLRVDASEGFSVLLDSSRVFAVRKAYQLLIFYMKDQEPIQLPVDDREELADLYERVVAYFIRNGKFPLSRVQCQG